MSVMIEPQPGELAKVTRFRARFRELAKVSLLLLIPSPQVEAARLRANHHTHNRHLL